MSPALDKTVLQTERFCQSMLVIVHIVLLICVKVFDTTAAKFYIYCTPVDITAKLPEAYAFLVVSCYVVHLQKAVSTK